jgi:hypothetical protein
VPFSISLSFFAMLNFDSTPLFQDLLKCTKAPASSGWQASFHTKYCLSGALFVWCDKGSRPSRPSRILIGPDMSLPVALLGAGGLSLWTKAFLFLTLNVHLPFLWISVDWWKEAMLFAKFEFFWNSSELTCPYCAFGIFGLLVFLSKSKITTLTVPI